VLKVNREIRQEGKIEEEKEGISLGRDGRMEKQKKEGISLGRDGPKEKAGKSVEGQCEYGEGQSTHVDLKMPNCQILFLKMPP
jgi:hypothetical protein